MSIPGSHLTNTRLTAILFSVLVQRLGGTVKITQTDIDNIVYGKLWEEDLPDEDCVQFRYVPAVKQS